MAVKGNTLKKSKPREESEESPGKKSAKKSRSFGLPAWSTDGRARKITGIFFILLAIYLLFAFSSYLFLYFQWGSDDLFSTFSFNRILFDSTVEAGNWAGRLGAALSILLIKKGFGIAAFLLVLMLIVAGLYLSLSIAVIPVWKTIRNSLLGLIWIPIALGFIMQDSDFAVLGGVTGYQSALWLEGLLGKTGTAISLFFSLIAILVFAFNMPLELPKRPESEEEQTGNETAGGLAGAGNSLRGVNAKTTYGNVPEDKYNTVEFSIAHDEKPETIKTSHVAEDEPETDELPFITPVRNAPKVKPEEVEFTIEKHASDGVPVPEKEKPLHFTIDTDFDPTLDLPDYQRPTLELLDDYGGSPTSVNVQKEELEANKNRIVETLANYNIQIDTIKATIGPTVTLYEIIPAPGVRISKIKNLEDDIALSLAALGIRIIAPIPGKGTIGIEVPNAKKSIVSMKTLIASEKFQKNNFSLPIAIGKKIDNENFIVDLTTMPHLLMAGATGQCK